MLLNTIRQWLKQLVDWEKRVFLGYQHWVFECPFEAAQVRAAVVRYVDRKQQNTWGADLARFIPLPKLPGKKHVLGIIDGNCITLWARPTYDVFLLFPSRYIGSFVGQIVETANGSVITGRYGVTAFGLGFGFWRWTVEYVALGLINLFLVIWSLVIMIGLGLMAHSILVTGTSDQALPFVALGFFVARPLPVLLLWLVTGFWKWLDSSSRRTVHLFLEWISTYGGSASSA